MKYIIAPVIIAMLLIACNTTSTKENSTGISPADSLLNKIENKPSFPAIADSSKLVILKRDGKQVNYQAYIQSFAAEDLMGSTNAFEIRDIDQDGNAELISSHYTGGAHCCDVNTILSRTGEAVMTEVLDYTGGTSISKDTVTISFYEALGYFHTCYACGVDYPKDAGPDASFIFKKGSFSFLPYSQKTDEDCETNIKAIVSKGIPDKDSDEESGHDNGTRKMIAFNLVAYYFNNQRDLAKTKSLFDKYYTHRDKDIIWKDLVKSISYFDEDIKKGIRLQ